MKPPEGASPARLVEQTQRLARTDCDEAALLEWIRVRAEVDDRQLLILPSQEQANLREAGQAALCRLRALRAEWAAEFRALKSKEKFLKEMGAELVRQPRINLVG